jgi:hypothetical protein
MRDGIFYHCDIVTKLSAKAHRRLHARARYHSDDDGLVNAVLLEQQVQIRVGKAARAPMLCRNDFTQYKKAHTFAAGCEWLEHNTYRKGAPL